MGMGLEVCLFIDSVVVTGDRRKPKEPQKPRKNNCILARRSDGFFLVPAGEELEDHEYLGMIPGSRVRST